MSSEHLERPRDLNNLWEPVTPEEKGIDEQWRNEVGFGLSELGLTYREVSLLGTPFRSPVDHLTLAYLLEEGAIRTKEPLDLGEGQELPTIERAKLMVERTGGKEGLSQYLKAHATIIAFVQQFADEVMSRESDAGRG